MDNRLFEFTMRVLRTEGSDLPAGASAAYVTCYAAATDPRMAMKKGVAAVAETGWRFDDSDGAVREIPADQWREYVRKVWPDHAAGLPSPAELPAKIAAGAVFFGPFSVFGT